MSRAKRRLLRSARAKCALFYRALPSVCAAKMRHAETTMRAAMRRQRRMRSVQVQPGQQTAQCAATCTAAPRYARARNPAAVNATQYGYTRTKRRVAASRRSLNVAQRQMPTSNDESVYMRRRLPRRCQRAAPRQTPGETQVRRSVDAAAWQ